MDKLLYISTGIPKEEVDRLRKKQFNFSSNALLPISVFHGNLLSGLANAYDEVCALSGVPISRKNFKLLRYSGKQIHQGNIRYIIPGFFTLPGIKQLTTMGKLWWHIVRWCRKNRSHNCHILIDGTFYTGLLPLWLAARSAPIRIGAILVDHYSFMDPSGTKPTQRLYRKLLSRMDKFVFVTDHLEQLINRDKKPYMIMEGLVADCSTATADTPVGDYCVYAGGLHEIYGVQNLVDAFHRSDLPYDLHLYGNGDLIDYIQEVAAKDPRIVYKGIVSHDALMAIERGAKLLINPRPVRGKLDTRFNFPSKLMEFMQSGRPVITTRLLGIPKEYDSYMYFFADDSEQGILDGIQRILSMDEAELAAFGQNARQYVNTYKNNTAVGQKIFTMMNTDPEE